VGAPLIEALSALAELGGGPLVSVGGRGLLIALEFAGSGQVADDICRAMAADGLFAVAGQVARNTVVLRPSLFLSEAEAAEIVERVAGVLEVASSPGGG
jgi:acetylornithine/succinyldiaminopimelate/putrescine aminotransferase